MNTRSWTRSAVVVLLSVTGCAFPRLNATDASRVSPESPEARTSGNHAEELRYRDLIHARVGDTHAHRYGEITDLLVNLPSGSAVYALVSDGAKQDGIAEVRLVPFEQLSRVSPGSSKPEFTISPKAWDKASRLDVSKSEDLNADRRLNRREGYDNQNFTSNYLTKEGKSSVNSPPSNVVRASRFLDRSVLAGGSLIGHAQDFIVNTRTREMTLVVNRAKTEGNTGKLLDVPLNSFMEQPGDMRSLITPRTLSELQASSADRQRINE